MAERSNNSKIGFDKTNRSINEMMTRQSGSAYSNMKGSNQSQSMTNIKFAQKAATAMRFRSPSERNDPYVHIQGGTIAGGTFSKANAPKTVKSMNLTAKSSFFLRVIDENNQNNKDMNLSQKSKKGSNMSFTSIQKSLNKL
jgi:hypothetical protein